MSQRKSTPAEFKFDVGDRIKLKSWEEIRRMNPYEHPISFNSHMEDLAREGRYGKVAYRGTIWNRPYYSFGMTGWNWAEEWIEKDKRTLFDIVEEQKQQR